MEDMKRKEMKRSPGGLSPFVARLGDRPAQIPGQLLTVAWAKGNIVLLANFTTAAGSAGGASVSQGAVYAAECRAPRSEEEARAMALKLLAEFVGTDWFALTGTTLTLSDDGGNGWSVCAEEVKP